MVVTPPKKNVMFCFRVSDETLERFREAAAKDGRSLASWLTRLGELAVAQVAH